MSTKLWTQLQPQARSLLPLTWVPQVVGPLLRVRPGGGPDALWEARGTQPSVPTHSWLCLTPTARPQVRWTKTAGSASDKFQETSVFNETLRIERVARTQGGRYYCKAENGVGVPAIKSIRVDVQCESGPRPVGSGGQGVERRLLGDKVSLCVRGPSDSSLLSVQDQLPGFLPHHP